MKNLLINKIIKLITDNFVSGIEYQKSEFQEFNNMSVYQLYSFRKELIKTINE